MKRHFDPAEVELMDRTRSVSGELDRDLLNLEKMNRWFGGHGLVRRFMRKWCSEPRAYRLLDLGTGGGDIPRMIVDWARRHEISVRIDAIDVNPAILEIAERRSRRYPEISFIQSDALCYTSPACYDIVLSSLTLHHFSNEDAVRLLQRARELSYGKVIITDLERSAFTSATLFLLTALIFRNPMTRHDARLSAKRAFTFREAKELARLAGWEGFGHRRFFPARQALWLDVRDEAPVLDLSEPALDFAT